MPPNFKKATFGQSNYMDRLSDLPDSILHHIISYLGPEESCRTTILSQRWINVWSTGLILDFNPRLFEENAPLGRGIFHLYKKESIDEFMDFIETTMLRYSVQNLSIRKFKLDYPTTDPYMTGKIDRWLGIAVQNQVESLSLSIMPEDAPLIELSSILFSATSLLSLTCCRIRVPYCQSLKLTSLQSLELSDVDIDEHMLQYVILSCPLKELRLWKCNGLKNILVPQDSMLELLHVTQSVSVGGTIVVDTSSCQDFTYRGDLEDNFWPIVLKPASKKSLEELRIFSAVIMDSIVDKLVLELSSIKRVYIYGCVMPKKVRIASPTLENLGIHDGYDLVNLDIVAPKLKSFCYNGDLQLSSVTCSHSECNVYLHLTLDDIDTQAVFRIKKLLIKSKCCKILSIILNDEPQIEFDKDQLSKIHDGSPYEVPELKLSLSCSSLSESSLTALVDGLFWSCRPDILSFSVTLAFDNQNSIVSVCCSLVMSLVEILQKKAKCWKHPLKRIEVEGTSCPDLFCTWEIDLQLRLYW